MAEHLHPVREIPHALIPLSDGTRLAARIWLPRDAETRPVPAILEYLPYRKRDGTWERDALTHPYLAAHGYACLRVDIRGSGESDGLLTDEYAPAEQDDALEVIAWIAAQRWCTGAVGMMGISWGGFNALQVAARRPRALKAIITLCSTDDRFADDVHFIGGALLSDGLGWAAVLQSFMAHPPDPALMGERWREMWLRRLNETPLFLARWLRHQRRDAYWRHGSVCEDYAAIACPVLAVGGWTDAYTNAIPRLLEHLTVPRQGLIGPWAHRYPHIGLPGPAVGFLQHSLRWWDHWLKGLDTGVMAEPMLRTWMMESVRPAAHHAERPGRWIAEPGWPPATIVRAWHLADAGLSAMPGQLTPAAVCSPQDLGTTFGSWCPFGAGADDAEDQRADDAGSVVFDTEPLNEAAEILGAPELELELASDRPRANLIARLCDVAPDGASLRVSYGVLNLAHHDPDAGPQALRPGEKIAIHLRLNDVAFRFPAGHRIRVALSTTSWPLVWPAPEQATLILFRGTLRLPERAPRADDAALEPLPPPATAPPAPRAVLREGDSHREAGRDIATGERFYRMVQEMTVVRLRAIGLELGSAGSSEFRIRPDDPLSARVEMRRTQTVARGEWRVRTETCIRLTAGADSFRVEAWLEAFEGERRVCRREWDEAIPREWV